MLKLLAALPVFLVLTACDRAPSRKVAKLQTTRIQKTAPRVNGVCDFASLIKPDSLAHILRDPKPTTCEVTVVSGDFATFIKSQPTVP
jgi:hypothetical protein